MRTLRSPQLALFVLSLTTLYAAAVSWLPWLASAKALPPAWAVRLGLDHPFRSLPFFAACGLLFVNTLVCTSHRLGRVRRYWRGELPVNAVQLSPGPADEVFRLFREVGFREVRGTWFKNRFALSGGFVLHVGILLVIFSVAFQQAFCDGGAFEIGEREVVRLDQPGVVFSRETGYFGPAAPPRLAVALDRFEAHLRQRGYAPDRRSRLVVMDPSGAGGVRASGEIDRARGLAVGDVTIHQAMPSGFGMNIATPLLGVRCIRLRETDASTAVADVTDPAGVQMRFVLHSDDPLSSPRGLRNPVLRLERAASSQTLQPGDAFPFGRESARFVALSRWGGFTYARTPGVGAVFAGFGVVLVGCFLLLFPAGVARTEGNANACEAKVYLPRGVDVLLLEWEGRRATCSACAKSRPSDTPSPPRAGSLHLIQ